MLTADTFWTNLLTVFHATTAGFPSHLKSRPGESKSLPGISSCIDEWPLSAVRCIFRFALLPSIGESLLTGFHQIQNLTCLNMCLGIKKTSSRIPKGPFSHSHVLPQNKWWRHLNYRRDRVIHQALIKAFYWSQHYRAIFLRNDREGKGNLLKTNLSRGIIFIFMMTLQ